jgi:hypothetical protein
MLDQFGPADDPALMHHHVVRRPVLQRRAGLAVDRGPPRGSSLNPPQASVAEAIPAERRSLFQPRQLILGIETKIWSDGRPPRRRTRTPCPDHAPCAVKMSTGVALPSLRQRSSTETPSILETGSNDHVAGSVSPSDGASTSA